LPPFTHGEDVLIIALENKLGDLGSALAETTHVEWSASLGESVGIVTGLIFVTWVLLFRHRVGGDITAARYRRRP